MTRVVHSFDFCELTWHDTEQTVLVADIHTRWTWDDARALLVMADTLMEQRRDTICFVMAFGRRVPLLPAGQNALHNIRKLLERDTSPEQLTVIVAPSRLLSSFIELTGRVNERPGRVGKFAYAPTLPDALALIAKHRSAKGTAATA